MARCPGPPRELRAIRWASRFTDASRQAERYADGRVLLAGDAAHIHAPAGGQGLNLGMQDAFNLGWKLAAVARGRAPAELLATYHTERHPVGARVLANTRAQMALTLPDPDAMAVRDLLADLLTTPEANHHIAAMIAGTDIRYPMPDAPHHPRLGARAPGVQLPSGRAALLADPRQRPPRRWRRGGATGSTVTGLSDLRPTAPRHCWSVRTVTSAGPAEMTTRTACAPPLPVGSGRFPSRCLPVPASGHCGREAHHSRSWAAPPTPRTCCSFLRWSAVDLATVGHPRAGASLAR